MGSQGGLDGRLGAGVRGQSKGFRLLLSSQRSRAWLPPGSLELSERQAGAGAADQGASREEVVGTWGSPVQARTLGPASRQAPIPQPRVLATELSFRVGRASTAARGPFPLACLNLAPPQATRPLPHPLASSGESDGEGPTPALGKEDCSLVLSGRINVTHRSEDSRVSGHLSGSFWEQ